MISHCCILASGQRFYHAGKHMQGYITGWSQWLLEMDSLKAGTHRPNRWTSEAFGKTRTRSGTNLFGVQPHGGYCVHFVFLCAPFCHSQFLCFRETLVAGD